MGGVLLAVERWHFRNHVGKYCRENCNPGDHPEVNHFNTVICEQKFKWVAGFKKLTNAHMSGSTFNFLLLLISWIAQEQYLSPYTAL